MCCPGVSRFLPTSRRLVQFSEGKSAPEGATIVYIDGAFDVFHVGHVEILRVRWSGATATLLMTCAVQNSTLLEVRDGGATEQISLPTSTIVLQGPLG